MRHQAGWQRVVLGRWRPRRRGSARPPRSGAHRFLPRGRLAMKLLVALIALAAGRAEAQAAPPTAPPTFVRLVYVPGLATEICPPAAAFEDEVSARLGRYAFSEVADTLLVVAIERGQSSGFHGRFFVRSAGVVSGERRMQLGSCRELVRSLAAAVSVWLAAPP